MSNLDRLLNKLDRRKNKDAPELSRSQVSTDPKSQTQTFVSIKELITSEAQPDVKEGKWYKVDKVTPRDREPRSSRTPKKISALSKYVNDRNFFELLGEHLSPY